MTVAEKLNYLRGTKNEIKEAIKEKGVNVSDADSFKSYASKIGQLEKVSNCLTENTINDMNNIFLKIFKLLPKDVISFLSEITTTRTSTGSMFSECINLTELDLRGLDTSNIVYMGNMFYNCTNLTELDLRGWDTSNVTKMEGMFKNCENLVTVHGILNCDKASNTNSFILGCVNLETIYIKNFNTPRNNIFSDCVKLSHESLVYWINNLKQSDTVKTITFGSINLAKLTEEEIAVATEKNWTLS